MKSNELLGIITATIGGVLGWIWGEITPLFLALIAFMVIDYISGVAAAAIRRELSSAVGFKGIVKKIVVLLLIGVAHILDLHVLGSAPVLQSAITMFFLANEGISLVENAAGLGIPIPKKLVSVLKQLKMKAEPEQEESKESEEK